MIEITNNIRKLIASLGERKHRHASGLFKAEGTKCVFDTINHFTVEYLAATDSWLSKHDIDCNRIMKVTSRDIQRMSSLSTPADVIAVYQTPQLSLDTAALKNELILALDGIQDPGNLGTIIRTADWFGLHTILCSRTTADAYSPKVVQSTMGAISRARIHYCNLAETITNIGSGTKVYGTLLNGNNIYPEKLASSGIIVMGNEGNGLSDEIRRLVTDPLTIPSYPPNQPTSESLNVAIATAITLSEFRRRTPHT